MNRTRLLMIGVLALALGAFVSLFVYNLQTKNRGNNESGVDVIVAADDIGVGSKIDAHDVHIARLPPGELPAGAFAIKSFEAATPAARQRFLDQALGRGVVLPISKGEFILPNKLAGENAGSGLPSLITNGMRAVSVRVNEVVSVAGFVTPDTRVDVLLTGTPVGSAEPQTTTVLQNVRVLASGRNLEKSANGEAQTTAVITLLVTPDDAQKLTLAQSEGHIQLSLRNPLDTRQAEVPASNAKGLFKGGTPVVAPPAPVHVHTTTQKKTVQPPPPATGISVEVYQGDKKPDVVKFPDENPDTK
jgi:pilus assembly protein CpaB